MSCAFEQKNGYILAVLGFRRDQLLYDISNCAYVEGSVMETSNEHLRHTVQDVAQQGNVDRVTRVLDLAVARCKEMLYTYTKYEPERFVLDNKLREPGYYGIVLKLPSDFSQTTLNLLEKLIHEYLVCTAIADWMSITNPTKRETWAMKAAEVSDEIRANLHTRMSATRRKLYPF